MLAGVVPSLGVLVLILIVLPTVVAVGLGIVDARGRGGHLRFTCYRCGGAFRQRGHVRFPAACPRCGATDWNLPAR